MAKEKVKIRVAELENNEMFKYKKGIFRVVFNRETSARVIVIKPRKVESYEMATPVNGVFDMPSDTLVRRYNPLDDVTKH